MQGLNKPWYDDNIFLMCPHNNRERYGKEVEGSRLFPAIKTKYGFGDSVK